MQTMKTSLLPLLLLSAGIANAQNTPQVPAITSALNDNGTAAGQCSAVGEQRTRTRAGIRAAARDA